MYAIVTAGGGQVKVSEGDTFRVEKIDLPVGDTITMEEVCLVVGDEGIVAEPEALASAKVICDVVAQGRGKKIRVFKKKRRKNYSRAYGHRQAYTELRVREILEPAKAEPAPEPEPEPEPESKQVDAGGES